MLVGTGSQVKAALERPAQEAKQVGNKGDDFGITASRRLRQATLTRDSQLTWKHPLPFSAWTGGGACWAA